MKKIIVLSFVALSLIFPKIISADAVDCNDSCPVGEYKTKISGTNLCECLPDTANNPQGAQPLTNEVLDQFDPLKTEDSPYADQLSTPGGIISRVLDFAFPLAGMVLFVMILVGGLQILMGGGEQKAMQAGQQRVTMAVVGFLLLFASYWIAQVLEQILNIKIL